jgi:hypothetical protein
MFDNIIINKATSLPNLFSSMTKWHQHPPNSLPPRTTRKSYGRDTQGTIHPTTFLKRLKKFMEGIPRGLSTRLPSSNDSKELWNGYPVDYLPNSIPQMTQKSYGRDTQGT